MTRVDELRNDGGSDKASSPCKKHAHTIFSFSSAHVAFTTIDEMMAT